MPDSNVKDVISRLRTRCSYCTQAMECLQSALSPLSIPELDKAAGHSHILHRGEHLFRAGQKFQSIYIIRSGAVKTYCIDHAGRETVVGLYLPTELLGVDAIESGKHPYSAVALETSSYCPITYEQLTNACRGDPELQEEIACSISRELLKEEERILMMLAHRNSRQQLAAFLLNLSARYRKLGYSWQEFKLPFGRLDLGSYLGLTLETVSRMLSNLQSSGIIRIQGRHVQITDLDALVKASGDSECGLMGCDILPSKEQRATK